MPSICNSLTEYASLNLVEIQIDRFKPNKKENYFKIKL